MDGRQKPDPQHENENELNDEEIIDLTQVIEGEDDDDVIDLNDILEQPEKAPLVEDDDGVIDLLEVAEVDVPEEKKDVAASPSTEGTEDIIDLMDAVAPEAADPEDEEFADLESRADAMLADTVESMDGSDAALFGRDRPEEAVQASAPDSDFMVIEDGEAGTPESVEPEAIIRSAAAMPVSPATPSDIPSAEPPALTETQLQAALERVIEKVYGEKIEQMMIQAIEKTVSQEIEKIKTALLEDNDGSAG